MDVPLVGVVVLEEEVVELLSFVELDKSAPTPHGTDEPSS